MRANFGLKMYRLEVTRKLLLVVPQSVTQVAATFALVIMRESSWREARLKIVKFFIENFGCRILNRTMYRGSQFEVRLVE